jgi:hypothetical protein
MDVHKDCYSAINLTQQGGPYRRETLQMGDQRLVVGLLSTRRGGLRASDNQGRFPSALGT